MGYRDAVGPPDKYDYIGALQFTVLFEHGLREKHYLLDIGCGSLRGGRLFIPYLLPGHYCEIEPNEEAVNQGIEHEIGKELVFNIKKAEIYFNDQFDFSKFNVKEFDYILAQSIFSHTSTKQTWACIRNVAKALKSDGLFIGTWFEGHHNWHGDGWRRSPVVTRPYSFLEGVAQKNGLSLKRLNHNHPSGQKWFLMKHE